MDAPIFFDNITSFASLRYKGAPPYLKTILSTIPPLNATPLTKTFIDSLRSINSNTYPARVPLTVDHSLFFAVTVGVNPCETCLSGSKLVSAINNITFVMPSISLLEAHYYNIKGVFTDDFPAKPPMVFNYTGTQPANIQTNNGTRLYRLNFNSSVEIVLQGTAMIAPENHPFHLHGYNFFVVGQGLGNFDPEKDPERFNLVDPVERNTIGIPNDGWAAIRFRADNPGLKTHLYISLSSIYL
jgi:laccase